MFVFTAADVTKVLDASGRYVNKSIRIDDAQELARLGAFFPGVGAGRTSATAGGWKNAVIVRFSLADNTTVEVRVDPNYRWWTEGRGDWPLREEFAAFITKLFEQR